MSNGKSIKKINKSESMYIGQAKRTFSNILILLTLNKIIKIVKKNLIKIYTSGGALNMRYGLPTKLKRIHSQSIL